MACGKRAAAVVMSALLVASCAQPGVDAPHGEPDAVHWGHEGAGASEHWGALSPDYAMCAEGRAQSPIDIEDPDASALDPLEPCYEGQATELAHLGHTLQLAVEPRSTLHVGARRASLLQGHFHVPSEHTVAGERFPLEAHFVHRDEAGALLVVGVLYREDDASPRLGAVIAALPGEEGQRHAVGLDVRAIGPEAGEPYNRYDASLTTPPCSEGVAWHVLQAPRTVSAEQLAAVRHVLTTSARPTQPIHGRQVRVSDRE